MPSLYSISSMESEPGYQDLAASTISLSLATASGTSLAKRSPVQGLVLVGVYSRAAKLAQIAMLLPGQFLLPRHLQPFP